MRHIFAILFCLAAAAPAAAQRLSAARVSFAVPSALPACAPGAAAPAALSLAPLAAPALAAPALAPQDAPAPAEFLGTALAAALAVGLPAPRQAAALGVLFDGAFPAASVGPSAPEVHYFNAAYGFYSWLAAQPELPSAREHAAVLLAALSLLESGPVIVTKEAASLSVLSAKNPSLPAASIALPAAVSPQAEFLAGKLESARARDRAEGGVRMRTAELLANLSAIARETAEGPRVPAPDEGAEALPDRGREPRAYLDRLLRDAMRSGDPFETLALLITARQEARALLPFQEASRFLERLRGGAELLAGGAIPRLLKEARYAAGSNDAARTDRLLCAALEFCEYAPAWKPRVGAAGRDAAATLELLKRSGPLDEQTGQPVAVPAAE